MKTIDVSLKVFIIGLIGILCLFSDPTEVGREWDWHGQIAGGAILFVAWVIHKLETQDEEE